MANTLDILTLINISSFTKIEPIAVDLVYADAKHPRNIFTKSLYQASAQCWVHKDIAAITILAARLLRKRFNYTLEIKDCLRTSDAQAEMQNTDIVRANPHWMEEPRLLAPPGAGAHPRAMAIDVCVLDEQGKEVDMGTGFDEMIPASARHYTDLEEYQLDNRHDLERAYKQSAQALGFKFLPYPEEWWDFRFYQDQYEQFSPLSDADLPPQMQMTHNVTNNIKDFDQDHFEKLAEEIICLVDNAYASL